VVPDSAVNLIAPRALFPFSWGFFYSGGYEGSRLEVPGVAGFKLRHGPGHAHAYLDLVRTPEGATVKNAACRQHDGLRVYSFMVESGAKSSLVRDADRDILSRTNEFAGLTVVGIGGMVQPLGVASSTSFSLASGSSRSTHRWLYNGSLYNLPTAAQVCMCLSTVDAHRWVHLSRRSSSLTASMSSGESSSWRWEAPWKVSLRDILWPCTKITVAASRSAHWVARVQHTQTLSSDINVGLSRVQLWSAPQEQRAGLISRNLKAGGLNLSII
jgi:hypothetical protein